MNTLDILLEMDKGTLERDVAEVEIKSLSKKTGKKVVFKIKELNDDEWMKIQDRATTIKKKSKDVDFNMDMLRSEVILNSLVDPDLKSKDLLDKLGVVTPKQALKKLLKAGEIKEVYESCEKLAGYRDEDDDEKDEDIEEIKN